MRQRRLLFEKDPVLVLAILREGAKRANAVANETLALSERGDETKFLIILHSVIPNVGWIRRFYKALKK